MCTQNFCFHLCVVIHDLGRGWRCPSSFLCSSICCDSWFRVRLKVPVKFSAAPFWRIICILCPKALNCFALPTSGILKRTVFRFVRWESMYVFFQEVSYDHFLWSILILLVLFSFESTDTLTFQRCFSIKNLYNLERRMYNPHIWYQTKTPFRFKKLRVMRELFVRI